MAPVLDIQFQEAGDRARFCQTLAVLKACVRLRELPTGKRIHAQLLRSGEFQSNNFLATSLVDMYSKCGSFINAFTAFQAMEFTSIASWNCIILACADNRECHLALELFFEIEQPNHISFLAAIKASIGLSSLKMIRRIHLHALKSLGDLHAFVENSLITAYARTGHLERSTRVFEAVQKPGPAPWTGMIMSFAESCQSSQVSLHLFNRMLLEGNSPTHITILAALKACTHATSIEQGRFVHREAARYGLEDHPFVVSSLMIMYSECGVIEQAHRVFECLLKPNNVNWNCLISAHARCHQPAFAFQIHWQMRDEDSQPDAGTFVALLKVIGQQATETRLREECLIRSRALQSLAIKTFRGRIPVLVANVLLDLYGKLGSMDEAWMIFSGMPERSSVSWNSIILGYAQSGHGEKALELFQQMQDEEKEKTDHITYLAAFKACMNLAETVKPKALSKTREINHKAMESGHGSHTFVMNAAVAAFAKCGGLDAARGVFERMNKRDLVSWNSMILGYAENGDGESALQLFHLMHRERDAEQEDELTYVAVLKACSSLAEKQSYNDEALQALLANGKKIHARAAARGLLDIIFISNSLMDLYAKCRSMVDALSLFYSMPGLSIVSWNCIILGLTENGDARVALKLFEQVSTTSEQQTDSITFIAALKACGELGDVQTGRRIHEKIRRAGLQNETPVAHSLINFFGKCGCMPEAKQVFNKITNKQLVSWNALLDGYSRKGDMQAVVELLEQMNKQQVKPDGVSLLSVLGACCHIGLVDEGRKYFEEMTTKFGVEAGVKHYNCMVDLLGRANRITEALEFIRSMKKEPSCMIWMTLLGACCRWKNVRVGEIAFQNMMNKEASGNLTAAACVLMSNLYAETGKESCLEQASFQMLKKNSWGAFIQASKP